jgi:hypothetical protein
MPTNRPFPIDPAMTAIAVNYQNPDVSYIADEILPRIPVGGEQFSWTSYSLAEQFNIPDARVARKGRPQQLEFTGTELTDFVIDYGYDAPIPYTDIMEAEKQRERGLSAIDPRFRAVQRITDSLKNQREVRVATMLTTLATYDASRRITLSGTSQLSDYVNSDPIGVLRTGMDATLVMRPNTVVMGREVWSRLSSHPKIVNAVKGNAPNSGVVSVEQFVELMSGDGIRRVLIGDSFYNSAKPGQTQTLTRAWGKHIALLYVNSQAADMRGDMTFGFTADYGGRIAGEMEDKNIGLLGGTIIRTGERVKEVICAPSTSYFIQNAIA